MLVTEIKYIVRCTQCGYTRDISVEQYKHIEMLDRICPACSDSPTIWNNYGPPSWDKKYE